MLIGDKLDYAYYTIILKKKKGWQKIRNGGGRIRTSDAFQHTRFPSERTKPLCDASMILSISRQSIFKQKERPGASA